MKMMLTLLYIFITNVIHQMELRYGFHNTFDKCDTNSIILYVY